MVLRAGGPCVAVCVSVIERLVQHDKDRLVRRCIFSQSLLEPVEFFRGQISAVFGIPLGVQDDKVISADPFVKVGLAVRRVSHVILVIFEIPAFCLFPAAGEPAHIMVAHGGEDLELVFIRCDDVEISLGLAHGCIIAVISAVEHCRYAGSIIIRDVVHGVDQFLIRGRAVIRTADVCVADDLEAHDPVFRPGEFVVRGFQLILQRADGTDVCHTFCSCADVVNG